MSSQASRSLPAIPAAKQPLAAALIYRLLLRRPLQQSFDGVYLHVEGRLPTPADGPLLFYLNHPAWWDGHLCALIDREVLGRSFDSYIMMEEQQLRRYRFFRRLGAFSVDRQNLREAARSVAYSADLLRQQRGRACWIFPQGEITPNDRRPLLLYPGLAHIARRIGSATLCPIALRYELRGEQRPDAFIRIGPLHAVSAPISIAALTDETTQRMTAAVDSLRDEVLTEQLAGYARILRGRPGINRVFDRLMGRD